MKPTARVTEGDASGLVRIACAAATASPGASLAAIVERLPELLDADAAVACAVGPDAGGARVRLLCAQGRVAGDVAALVARVSAIDAGALARPVVANGPRGAFAALGCALGPDASSGHVVLAAARAPSRGRYGARERVLLALLAPVVSEAVEALADLSLDALSPREREVARHAARGLGDREIARELGIGFATVRTHLRRAFDKLGVSSRTELAWLALAAGADAASEGPTPRPRRPAGRRAGRTRARGR